jgi:hypothetical protein
MGTNCVYELVYQRIEWKDADGKTVAMDDWSASQ